MDIKKSRFRDATWFQKVEEFTIPIVIGGSGGIGSWLTLFLSRNMTETNSLILYDFDRVEEVNIAGQLFRIKDVGKLKAEAMRDIVKDFSGFTGLTPMNKRYGKESLRGPVMFSCFDNMEARKDMFENWKREANGNGQAIFIDGRLLAEQFQVYFVTRGTEELYQNTHLFDDSEVDDVRCTYKQTTHFAAMIAGKMVQGFTNWLDGTFEVPFRYEEIGNLFLNETKP